MGSGKRNYKKRPKVFSLGGFKSEKQEKPKKEEVDKLIELWKKSKKRKDENKT